MGRKKGNLNRLCVSCGNMFHSAPSRKNIRCKSCRLNKQSKGPDDELLRKVKKDYVKECVISRRKKDPSETIEDSVSNCLTEFMGLI